MPNMWNQSFFGKSIGQLQSKDASKISTQFVFGALKSRNLTLRTPNLSWEVPFFTQILVAMTDFYTVIFNSYFLLRQRTVESGSVYLHFP